MISLRYKIICPRNQRQNLRRMFCTFSANTKRYFLSKHQSISRAMSMLVEKVKFSSENEKGLCPAVLIKNMESSSMQGLVILQEWWGINEQIQNEAKEIAESGDFITLVPDLYRGKIATDNEEAGHLMNNLDWPGAVKDIAGAAKYLLSKGCLKVGVTGFCMGGALSLAAAALVPEISASAPFYGIPSDTLCDVTKIKIPLQCHFGDLDEMVGFSSPKDVDILKTKLESAGVNFELYRYNAGHAFTHKGGPLYSEEACDISMKRLVQFMKKNLST